MYHNVPRSPQLSPIAPSSLTAHTLPSTNTTTTLWNLVIFQISKFHKYPLFWEGGGKNMEGGEGNQGMNSYKGVKIP